MKRFIQGKRVRIDIPDQSDPDHDRFHGEHGEVVAVMEDDAVEITGDSRDKAQYRVQ